MNSNQGFVLNEKKKHWLEKGMRKNTLYALFII